MQKIHRTEDKDKFIEKIFQIDFKNVIHLNKVYSVVNENLQMDIFEGLKLKCTNV